ncbi:hypothetical protein TARUN_5995 [Trichoderma arundinaceum]|uniref:Uncharacterized protein n=1 Tax=Trichoderma arundinaceum TaxID=490622 RepID=A0A395NJJ7_TRIAR|nr:hypothetical protein TARUN_5995 [Trichoderma arundinaceum]
MNGSSIDPKDASRIFKLLYTRLACLTLIDATSLAAQEAKALEDLNDARRYIDETTSEHLVPWELRVLHVRLQALGFGDPRRAVMSYHDLAREARDHVRKASLSHDNTARELWKSRLHELGIKVAGALIEMDDLSGAAHHLSSLKDRGDGKLALSKALLWLHLGDTRNAKSCASQCADDAEDAEKIILALCDMADSNYESALQKWQEFDGSTTDEMIGVNQSVCLIYLGRIQEVSSVDTGWIWEAAVLICVSQGRTMLEKLVDSGLSSHTLLFNLSTTYELCSERNRILKARLTEKVANMEESPFGWEKTNADFKL